MAIVTPQYLVGRNVSLMSAAPMNVDNTGTMTVGTVFSLKTLGVFDSFEFEGDLQLEEKHSADAVVANYLAKFDDWTITVSEIIGPSGYSNLYNAFYTGLYFRVNCQATAPAYGTGLGSAGNQFVAVGIRNTIRYGMTEGANSVVATFKPCGLSIFWGTGTPPY